MKITIDTQRDSRYDWETAKRFIDEQYQLRIENAKKPVAISPDPRQGGY